MALLAPPQTFMKVKVYKQCLRYILFWHPSAYDMPRVESCFINVEKSTVRDVKTSTVISYSCFS